MRVCDFVYCGAFPCQDVRNECHQIPDPEIEPERVSIVLISEAAPPDPADGYYAAGEPLFAATTLTAFRDAGLDVTSIQELVDRGIYLTTAVKCGKTGYGLQAATIRECSLLLQEELGLFPNIRGYLLMGDVAIKSLNYIARRLGEPRVIPAGSTYKIRNETYTFRGRRAWPSYLQAGPSFFIEKSKRQMIAEDLAAAIALLP